MLFDHYILVIVLLCLLISSSLSAECNIATDIALQHKPNIYSQNVIDLYNSPNTAK